MTPAECRTMAEVRAEIDHIDGMLVGLLTLRAGYIDRAAELKPALGLPARIDARVEEVVGKVRLRAMAEGLDPDLADTIWRHLIDWSIAREEAKIGRG